MNMARRSKRPLSLLVLVLGAALFTTAVFADLVSGTPYSDFKLALKETARYHAGGYAPNYTIYSMSSYALDGQMQSRQEEVQRFALDQMLYEDQRISYHNGEQSGFIRIEDGNASRLLTKNSGDDHWTIFEGYPFSRYASDKNFLPEASNAATIGIIGGADGPTSIYVGSQNSNGIHVPMLGWISDPVDDPRMQDIERIGDALIGNLANLLQAETTVDGGKHYSGTIIGAQLPPLLQALASFALKSATNTVPLKELQIEQVSGDAIQTPEGWLSKLTLKVHLSGVDDLNGKHTGLLEIGFEIAEIGTTTINLPDLSNLNIRYEEYKGYTNTDTAPMMQAKDFGHYRDYLMAEQDGTWIRVLERNVELREENGMIVGHYWEVPLQDDVRDPLEFTFTLENSYYRSDFIVSQIISGPQDGEAAKLSGWLHYGGSPGAFGFDIYNSSGRPYTTTSADRYEVWTAWFRVFAE